MGGKLKREFVVDVTQGETYTLALTKSGKVYSFGLNYFGQCGLRGSTEHPPIEPYLIPLTRQVHQCFTLPLSLSLSLSLPLPLPLSLSPSPLPSSSSPPSNLCSREALQVICGGFFAVIMQGAEAKQKGESNAKKEDKEGVKKHEEESKTKDDKEEKEEDKKGKKWFLFNRK